MELKLVNQLPEHTNLHFHGLHVSPEGDSDNVFLHVGPGETQDYSVTVGPGNQPGTYCETYPGKFIFHCHIFGHEDLGMMKTVEVEE
jgi:FtsP/CotA-like multicopper oxidase with cupredoxin domain